MPVDETAPEATLAADTQTIPAPTAPETNATAEQGVPPADQPPAGPAPLDIGPTEPAPIEPASVVRHSEELSGEESASIWNADSLLNDDAPGSSMNSAEPAPEAPPAILPPTTQAEIARLFDQLISAAVHNMRGAFDRILCQLEQANAKPAAP